MGICQKEGGFTFSRIENHTPMLRQYSSLTRAPFLVSTVGTEEVRVQLARLVSIQRAAGGRR